MGVYLHAFLTSAQDGGKWVASGLSHLKKKKKSLWYILKRR
jgi:hypothetical protein